MASLRLAHAIECGGSTGHAIANTLEIDERMIRRLADPDDIASLSMGDFEVLRSHHRGTWREYRRMERIDDCGEPGPGLDRNDHIRRIIRAVADAVDADCSHDEAKALRRVMAHADARLRDMEAGDEED